MSTARPARPPDIKAVCIEGLVPLIVTSKSKHSVDAEAKHVSGFGPQYIG